MKRMLVGVVALGVVLAGCSSEDSVLDEKDGSAKAGAHATLVQWMQKMDETVTDKEADCWASSVIDAVGFEDALQLVSEDPEAKPSAQADAAATKAVQECDGA